MLRETVEATAPRARTRVAHQFAGTPRRQWAMHRGVGSVSPSFQWVLGKERYQALGHAARILHVQQVRSSGEDESLGIGEPGEQHLLTGAPDRRLLLALLSDDRKHRLGDATAVLASERPLPYRWQLLTEECVGGGTASPKASGSTLSSAIR